jgi:photosystem II stability/assembly factor-like uncharacterized protein
MSGLTLTPYFNDISRNWIDTTSSSGKVLAACVFYGYIYTSDDYGNWSPRMNDLSRNWSCIACSSDGSNMVAGVYGGFIYRSPDKGVSWFASNTAGHWTSVASSYDGINFIACTTNLTIPAHIPNLLPTRIPHLQLWLDANDNSTLTFSGISVIQWNDKSGYGYHATPYNSTSGFDNSSTYNPTGFNNLPAIKLTKTGFSATSPPGTFINGITFFVVFKKTGVENNNEALINKTFGSNPSPFDIYNATKMVSNGTGFKNIGTDGAVTLGSIPLNIKTQTSETLYSSTINNSQWNEYKNGTAIYTNNYSTNFTDVSYNIYIGSRYNRSTAFEGFISEVIVYNRVLTGNERQLVERYLATKWNIPYSNSSISSANGYIYTSTDSGASWNREMSDITRNWSSVASSSDGTKLIAGVYNGYLYTKISNIWSARMNDLSRNWSSVSSSYYGTMMVASVYNGYLYTSTDFGFNWTPRMTDLSRNWSSVTSSSDGATLFATVMSGKLYTSNDYGQNWIENDLSRNWSSITSSRTTLISSVNDGYLYILNLLTYYNRKKTDLASYYIKRQDLLSIQPSSQSLTLNTGGFKMNNVLIDNAYSFYKNGRRKNSFFKVNNVDIGGLFQVDDVSYVPYYKYNYSEFSWGEKAKTITNAKFIWSNSTLPTQQQIYKHFFYYSFYYTQPDISGNIYATCNNAAIQIGFNGGASGQLISNVNNGLWSRITPSDPTPSSIRIKKGLNCIKIGVYNNRIPSGLYASFDANLNVEFLLLDGQYIVSKWTSVNDSSNYLYPKNVEPLLSTNFINSYPAVYFDIDGVLLNTNISITEFNPCITTDITLFFVIKMNNNNKISHIFCSTNGPVADGSLRLSLQEYKNKIYNLKISLYYNTGLIDWVTPLIFVANVPCILTINISNDVASCRYNGIPEVTTFTYGRTSKNILNNLDIGGWSGDTSKTFVGGIGEFIHYNRTLSLIEMQQVEYYLALKWGISSSGPNPNVQSYSIGLYCYYYNNYYFDNSYELFNTRPNTLYYKNTTNFSSSSYAITNTNSYIVQNYSTYMWYGLFKSPYSSTKDISFGLKTDDGSYLWFGDNAMEGIYSKTNANIDNGVTGGSDKQCSINVVNDIYYPIRIIYGQMVAGDFQFYYIIPGTTTKVYDLSNVVFYPAYSTGLNCYVYNNHVFDISYGGVYPNYLYDTSLTILRTKPYTQYNRNITNFSNFSYALLNNTDISYILQYRSTYMWYGLFKSPYSSTKDISFGLITDDGSYLWFGNNAMDGNYTLRNANIDNSGDRPAVEKQCSINVKNNIYYPIRIMYAQVDGNSSFQFYYIIPQTTTKVYDLSNVVFYPSNPDGLIVSLYDNNNNCIAYTNENWTYSIFDLSFSGTATNSIDDPYYFNEEATEDVPPPEEIV